MQKTSIIPLIVLSGLVAMTLPAYADSSVTYGQPTALYTTSTTDYGGGDGSGSSISSLGPFSFSSSLVEDSVTGSWSTWNSPPAVESGTPNVLYGNGAQSLTLTLSGSSNTAGFELEPDSFQTDDVTASFYDGVTLIDTIELSPNGNSGALLFALSDTTPGASISSIVITDNSSDDFAIAQLRAGTVNPVPEPGTLSLLGLGILGLAKRAYRKVKA